MKRTRVIAVEILTPEHKLLDYGFLEAKEDSLKLVTTEFKGTVLGAAVLVLLSSLYWFLISVPFLFFHIAPITSWNPISEVVVAVTVPAAFFVLLATSVSLFRQLQVRYPKEFRDITVSDFEPARFGQMITVRAGKDNLILVAKGNSRKLTEAMALAGKA